MVRSGLVKLASGVTELATVTTAVSWQIRDILAVDVILTASCLDRNLIHINKKGRPVSQCVHCRGLRKSRTTHVRCDCGDKKKDGHNTTSLPEGNHAGGDRGDHKCKLPHRGDDWGHSLTVGIVEKCRCIHGQRCTCALKKEHHLDPVPETGLLPPHATAVAECHKPRLTSTKSESILTVFRDGHHKPMHKHNDMAHKCGLPYTIPRSHTIHGTSEFAQRSADHLPLTQRTSTDLTAGFEFEHEFDIGSSQRRVKSEHGSPESAPVPALEQINTQIPPLDLASFGPYGTSAATDSPLKSMVFQDPYQDNWLTSPDTDGSMTSGAFNAPPVDWSSFPLCSPGMSATLDQAPSYASFDFNGVRDPRPSGMAASSSGEISEVDDFGPLPSLGASSNDLHDLHSVSDSSDIDHYRISSASSLIGLPQAQLLSSNNLESINIDDFLKSANESTAALELQLQASMAVENKSIPAPQHDFSVQQAQTFTQPESISPVRGLPLSVTRNDMHDMLWPATMFDPSMSNDAADDPFSQPPWVN